MASHHELSPIEPGSPYSEEVAKVSQIIGEEVGEQAAKQLSKQLEEQAARYPGLINTDVIPQVLEQEKRAAATSAVIAREVGLMNDRLSTEPGIFITGELDYRKLAQLRKVLQEHSPERVVDEATFKYSLQTEDTRDSRSTNIRYRLHLPEGGFEYMAPWTENFHKQRYLCIYPRAEFSPEGSMEVKMHLPMLHGGYVDQQFQDVAGIIGRVEGAGGTIWQNPKTNPDGSILTELEATATA